MLNHVRISVAGQSRDETKTDLDDDQLQTQFLNPYGAGEPIMINGRTVHPADLERIRITQTDRPADTYFNTLKARDQASNVAVIGGPSYSWRAAAMGTDITDEVIKGPPGYLKGSVPSVPVNAEPQLRRVTVPAGPGDGRTVFLVQGRNSALQAEFVSFLRSLDLKVIEWEQAVSMTGEPNPYIGDVITAGLEAADGVVVLATPDDLSRLDPNLAQDSNDEATVERGQPRQNVIYEAGMAMALAPSRTLMIAVRSARIMSDLAGRHLVYLDNESASRKRIVQRLQMIGLAVDDSGEDWLAAGNLD